MAPLVLIITLVLELPPRFYGQDCNKDVVWTPKAGPGVPLQDPLIRAFLAWGDERIKPYRQGQKLGLGLGLGLLDSCH